jgi:hypothetical protein
MWTKRNWTTFNVSPRRPRTDIHADSILDLEREAKELYSDAQRREAAEEAEAELTARGI